MTVEIGLLVAIIGAALTIAAFYVGRISAAKSDGKWQGSLDATLKHIQKDLEEIKENIDDNAARNRDSLRRVHDRIDAHLRDDHSIAVPRRIE